MAGFTDYLSSVYGAGNSPTVTNDLSQTGSKTLSGAIVGTPASNQTNAGGSVNQVTILPGLDGTVFGQPVTHLFLWAGIGIGIYWFLHHHGGIEKDLATPRVSLGSLFVVTFEAIIGITLLKAVLTKYRIPGLTELVGSA